LKKFAVVITLLVSLLVPTPAQAAQTQFTGSPLINLESQGANISIILGNFPSRGGLYMQQCLEEKTGSRPAICNKAAELWISASRGASFVPNSPIVFKPAGVFTSGTTTVDCTVSKCGVFLRYDHTVPGDLSEDQFFPLTFKVSTVGVAVLTPDEITANINGVALSTRDAFTLGYRQVAVMSATSKAGAALSYESLAPACAISNGNITALTGTGLCSIAVTSLGTATASATTVRFPIQLAFGTQTISGFKVAPSNKAGTKINFPKLTNFGEKITYRTSPACSAALAKATVKKGTCKVRASALGKADSYAPLMVSYTFKGK